MLSFNAKNTSQSQEGESNFKASTSSKRSRFEFSPNSSSAVRDNFPKRQKRDISQVKTNPSDNIPASGIQSITDSSSMLVVDKRLKVADQVLLKVRAQTPLKSTNKSYGNIPPVGRSHIYSQPKLSERYEIELGEEIFLPIDKIPVANCGDLSDLAWHFLMQSTWKKGDNPLGPIDIVDWGEDHACVVLGQPSTNGKFPDDFSAWHRDAVICDVWAKIVCKATEYPKAWQEKMRKWEGRKLKITTSHTYHDDLWKPCDTESPMIDKWFNLPNRANKIRSYIPHIASHKPIYKAAHDQGYLHVLEEMRQHALKYE